MITVPETILCPRCERALAIEQGNSMFILAVHYDQEHAGEVDVFEAMEIFKEIFDTVYAQRPQDTDTAAARQFKNMVMKTNPDDH